MAISKKLCIWSAAVAAIALAGTLLAQQTSSLSIAGLQGSARVIQVDGRNYVEVESLARLSQGSLSFNGSQIVLTLPNGPASSLSASSSSAPPRNPPPLLA